MGLTECNDPSGYGVKLNPKIQSNGTLRSTLAFGYIMMSIYIKVGDDILDEDVIKVVDMEDVAGMPLGTTVKSIVWSLIGVFVLELITGIFCIWGAIGRRQQMLAITVLMSSLMIIIYGIYLVILSILYHQKSSLRDTLYTYTQAYHHGPSYMSSTYYYDTFPSFLSKLGCEQIYTSGVYYCYENYNEQLSSYLKTYFGLIVTSIVCQIVTIVAVEYTYRKFEFKEKKLRISDNKYYFTVDVTAWNISKICHICYWNWTTRLGLTLIGDKFIHNSALRYIFRQIQFHNYYFYDILVGLAASAVVIGILTMVTSITGLIGSWRKSSVMSNVLHIPRIIAIIIWIYLVEEIDDGMKFQLGLQQQGYYYSNSQNTLTRYWNEMIMTLQCCGVHYYYETLSKTYGNRFCCTNAHESRMDPGSQYSNIDNSILSYFGGCYEHKTDSAGLWSVIMVGNIVQIGLWGKFISSVDASLTERLQTALSAYQYSHASARYDYYPWDVSLGWNTLFVKAECCGVGASFLSSFTSSSWYYFGDRASGQNIPAQCCVSQTEVYPYESKSNTDCTNSLFSGYYFSQGCDSAVEDRLKMYSTPFFVFMAVGILAEISCIVMTIYDAVRLPSEPNTLHVEEKANEGKIELNPAKSERKQSIEKQKSFVKQKTDETEKVKDNIEIQSLEETKKENERTGTNTEEMLDSKHLNKTENTKDDKKEETDSIDQHKNDETENRHKEKEDKTMKDTSIQINEETPSDRTELEDKLIEDVDAKDLVEDDL
ncbi:unnamed protein product [Mytilus edulis]|uniref:Tetraspanin n=1 Tax=Mytilus edulis TaxID=6550 RepID=A0A8S3SUG2_MYTED|nr:unnamed protein product [Mytilus edulis]